MSCIIFTDQHAPDGRTIRYNLDISPAEAALSVTEALEAGSFLEIRHESGREPIFLNPERVASITPPPKPKED
jgi:hypothetical protein